MSRDPARAGDGPGMYRITGRLPMTRIWIIAAVVVVGVLALLAGFAVSLPNPQRTLTGVQESLGFPPGASNLAWGEVPGRWEGPMRPALPVAFDLPPGTDRAGMLDFYRARCAAMKATTYGFGLDPDRFGPPELMCSFGYGDQRIGLMFSITCSDAACTAVQSVVLEH